jgi:hypothetical protein
MKLLNYSESKEYMYASMYEVYLHQKDLATKKASYYVCQFVHSLVVQV